MAKTKTAPGVKTRTAAIEQDAKAGRYPEAWQAARQLWAEEPTEAHVKLMQSVVRQACQEAIDAGSPGDFAKYIQWANVLPAGASNEWTITLAHLQAKAGYLSTAKKLLEPLNDPKAMAQALAFAADKSILARQAELLPEEYRAAYLAVLAAFEQYHTGNDEAARTSLNAVGLQSPYLDWKVLLRGLMAYSAKDDARAIENFQRLNAERLPGRLAKVFRANIDPAYRQQLAPEAVGTLDRCYQAMVPSSLAEKIRTIRQQCHPGRSLLGAFATVQSVLTQIKGHRPGLKEKLAHCMYHVLVNMGQPDDLKRYLKAFGPPSQDPDFHLMQGGAFELSGNLTQALVHWKHSAEWLRKVPAGWTAELAKRARAHILLRAGKIASDAATLDELVEDESDLFDMFAPPRKKKTPSKAKALAHKAESDPLPLLKEAVAMAPDWDEPVLALMEVYRENKDDKAAEAVANDYLAHSPASLPVLKLLVKIQAAEHRPEQLCGTWKRILALNPLDQDAILETTQAYVALARLHAVAKNMPACDAALNEAARLNDNLGNYAMLALNAALAVQRGEDGAAILAPMQDDPAPMLVAKYLLHVYAILLKFKPAMKKAAAAAFAEALQAQTEPIALASLWMEVERITKEGWKFTGEATLRKKVLAAILASPMAGGDEDAFDALTGFLEIAKEWATLQKFAAKLGKFFPRNPLYPYMEACAYTQLKPAGKYDQKVMRLAYKAEMILERYPNSKHADLMPEIQQMVDDFRPDYSFLDSFFGRR